MRYSFLILIILHCSGCIKATVTPMFEVYYPQGQTSSHGLVNEIHISTNENESLIEISSQSGIGSGIIKLIQGDWPEVVTARLYLKSLEGFTVSSEQITIDKSALSVSAYDKNGRLYEKKYLINERGYYEVKLPNRLFTDGPNRKDSERSAQFFYDVVTEIGVDKFYQTFYVTNVSWIGYIKNSKNINYYELPVLAQQIVYYAFQAEMEVIAPTTIISLSSEVKKTVDNLFFETEVDTELQLPHPNYCSFPNRYDMYKAKYVELLQQFVQ